MVDNAGLKLSTTIISINPRNIPARREQWPSFIDEETGLAEVKAPAQGPQTGGKARVQTWVCEPPKSARDYIRRLLCSPGSVP